MPRSRFHQRDVTPAVWGYLNMRYAADEVRDRRERIGAVLKRLVTRKGLDRKRVQRAMELGTRGWEAHGRQRMTHQQIRDHNRLILQAQTDIARALAALRRVVSESGINLDVSDDELFAMRDLVLCPLPELTARRKPGRPWEWKQQTEDALQQAGVGASDRKELITALGFLEDE